MIRPRAAPLALAAWGSLAFLLAHVLSAADQPAPAAPETSPGQFFPITEPITHETIDQVRSGARQLIDRNARVKGARPVLVFEFRPGDAAPGGTEFGSAYDLANFISTK